MATKTLYPLSSTPVTPNWWGNMQDGGTAPSNAQGFGWKIAKTAAYFKFIAGSTSSTTSSSTDYLGSSTPPAKGTGSSTGGDAFTCGPYSGTFASAAWTFNWYLQASTASSAVGTMIMRVWKSANADGSSPTQLSTAEITGASITMSTSNTSYNSSMSWSPGAITLNNEYLFFQIEFRVTTASGSNSATALIEQGSGTTGCTIVTPNFAANWTGAAAFAGAGGMPGLTANLIIGLWDVTDILPMAGAGGLYVNEDQWFAAYAAFTGNGALLADSIDVPPSGPTTWTGEALLAGAASLSVVEFMLLDTLVGSTLLLSGSGGLKADAPKLPIQVSALLVGAGTVNVLEQQVQTANALFAGAGLLVGNAIKPVFGVYTDPIPYLPTGTGTPPGFVDELAGGTQTVSLDTSEPYSDRILYENASSLDELTWSAPGGGLADCEALALIAINGPVVNGTRYPTLGIRVQTGVFSGFFFCFDANSTTGGIQVELARFNNGAWISSSVGSFTWTDGTWYWVRINETSGVRHARVWPQGTLEPGTWLI